MNTLVEGSDASELQEGMSGLGTDLGELAEVEQRALGRKGMPKTGSGAQGGMTSESISQKLATLSAAASAKARRSTPREGSSGPASC